MIRSLSALIAMTIPGFWTTEAGKHFYIYMIGPLLASIIAPLTALCLYGKQAGLSQPDLSKPKVWLRKRESLAARM